MVSGLTEIIPEHRLCPVRVVSLEVPLCVYEYFMSSNTEKASQLSLVRRPSVAVSKCTTGDHYVKPTACSLGEHPKFPKGAQS
jgi:hypothetical protein